MLRMVGFPDPKRALRTYPFELSGGLRQRAMIAMALVCRPALLIADEPTTALDVTIQAQILRLIKDLQAELGMALLMITHDLGVVANVADDVVVMYRGKVVESGDLHDIFRDPQHPYLKALLHAVPRFDMTPGERLVPIREITAATGHLLKEKAESPSRPPTFNAEAPVLKVRHLSKTFPIRKADTLLEQLMGGGTTRTIRAVNDVSFDVERGECLGLVGESGCGKTTLSKMLMRGVSADPNEGDTGRPHRVRRLGPQDRRAVARGRRARPLPHQAAVHLPGPVRLAQSSWPRPSPPASSAQELTCCPLSVQQPQQASAALITTLPIAHTARDRVKLRSVGVVFRSRQHAPPSIPNKEPDDRLEPSGPVTTSYHPPP